MSFCISSFQDQPAEGIDLASSSRGGAHPTSPHTFGAQWTETRPRRSVLALWIVLAAVLVSPRSEASLLFSEILTSNTLGLKDEDGQTSEWIELFNAGTTIQSLLGWSLTDDPAHAARWTFPATNLPLPAAGDKFSRALLAKSGLIPISLATTKAAAITKPECK